MHELIALLRIRSELVRIIHGELRGLAAACLRQDRREGDPVDSDRQFGDLVDRVNCALNHTYTRSSPIGVWLNE